MHIGRLRRGRRAGEPARAFEQAPQHLAVGGGHVEGERDDGVDHHVRPELALTLARAPRLVQNGAHRLERERARPSTPPVTQSARRGRAARITVGLAMAPSRVLTGLR